MIVATRKHIVASWNGGTEPDKAVISASMDHITIAEKPIRVACMTGTFRSIA
jgi:hypothetical protein